MKKNKTFALRLLALAIAAAAIASSVAGCAGSGVSPDGTSASAAQGGPAGPGFPDEQIIINTYSAPADITDKDEAVYARLNNDGAVRGVYIVNHFSIGDDGLITDYGDYSSVVNLTNTQTMSVSNGTVNVLTSRGDFYYQGYPESNELPWLYRIEYYLDGALIGPDELAGKSGRLELRLSSGRNPRVSEIFFRNYMQQITITLESDRCSNVSATGATAANAGKNRILVFTVLPGRNADITVTADVRDFEMAGIDITAMPFSMSLDIPDLSGMFGDFDLLVGAIAELDDGVQALGDGAAEIAAGAAELRDGSAEFLSGLSLLDGNSGLISGGSAQINDALLLIASSLSDTGDMPDIGMLLMLPEALSLVTDGLERVSAGMRQLKGSLEAAAAALDAAVAALPVYVVAEAQLAGLYDKADEDETALLDRLFESHTATLAFRDAYNQNRSALSSAASTVDSLAFSIDSAYGMLSVISEQINDALSEYDITELLGQLTGGMSELSRNYAAFHSGLLAFMQGVSELAGGYALLDEGIGELSGGLAIMSDGVSELRGGTGLLASETAGMPAQIETMIDAITSDYSGGGFDAISFTSDQNSNVSFVQFVFRTDGISRPSQEAPAPVDDAAPGFRERLLMLFGR